MLHKISLLIVILKAPHEVSLLQRIGRLKHHPNANFLPG